jgi:hypothetical protein
MQGTDGVWAKAGAIKSKDVVKIFMDPGVPPGFNNITAISDRAKAVEPRMITRCKYAVVLHHLRRNGKPDASIPSGPKCKVSLTMYAPLLSSI